MHSKIFMIGAVALLLSGCISQSQIQAKYVKSQNICRMETGRLFAGRESLGSQADAQAAVNNSFTECMTKAGWRAPKATQVAQTQNPPTGSPSTNPSAATSAVRQPPVENPPTNAAVQQQPNPVRQNVAQTQNPPSGAPSTNPSAAAARTPQNPAVTSQQAVPPNYPAANAVRSGGVWPYAQPARPAAVPAAPFGSSARRF